MHDRTEEEREREKVVLVVFFFAFTSLLSPIVTSVEWNPFPSLSLSHFLGLRSVVKT